MEQKWRGTVTVIGSRALGGVVILMSRIVFLTTFLLKFAAFVSVDIGVCIFLSSPLILDTLWIVAQKLAYHSA